ncbi:DUF5988 family protein [Streptomonospora nanhaiensis]|uniref:Uncharacterized protein n=1 Tax=Streptomonospora nanhaiensis TaxID=1323731 RepID=A0A853BKM1_9ACTN|nr:DUF5988 family protein [Streptomonospora nanhaiensis]MBV2362914.1 hypothetical protein [Streptomonospora nanhaiensis]MBX9391622.1 hypothetical protein [Streptomonospora nanhaiensis]NYI95275.1 hypothetical protein [Streptomonospora nanhaiensis]
MPAVAEVPGTGDAEDATEVVLVGGPADIPAELRVHRLRAGESTIKLLHNGGYEHFECVVSTLGRGRPPVFQWTGRTRIAE